MALNHLPTEEATTNDRDLQRLDEPRGWAFMLYVNNDEGLSMAHECVATAAAGAEWAPYMPDDDEMRAAFVHRTAADALKDWAESLFTRSGYADESVGNWPSRLADAAADIGEQRINWTECVTALTEEWTCTRLPDLANSLARPGLRPSPNSTAR